MLSNTCKYGIRAVIYLAVNKKENERIGIKLIAKELDLPTPFLGKILQNLTKNKLLVSSKGPHGGFSLAKDANKISLLDIVQIIDGLDFFHTCLIGVKVCEDDPKKMAVCPFHNKLDTLRDQMYEQFKKLTVGQFRDGFYATDEILKF